MILRMIDFQLKSSSLYYNGIGLVGVGVGIIRQERQMVFTFDASSVMANEFMTRRYHVIIVPP